MRKNKSLALKRRPPTQQFIVGWKTIVVAHLIMLIGLYLSRGDISYSVVAGFGINLAVIFCLLDIKRHDESALFKAIITYAQSALWTFFASAYFGLAVLWLGYHGIFNDKAALLIGFEIIILSLPIKKISARGRHSDQIVFWVFFLGAAFLAIFFSWSFVLGEVAQ